MSGDTDPLESVENNQVIEEVRQALDEIDPVQRDVVILRFLVGLPIKEVALILDKTIPAIKAMQFRGLMDLRKRLDQV